MKETAILVLGFGIGSAIFYSLMPDCAANETLVRGLFWFECI